MAVVIFREIDRDVRQRLKRLQYDDYLRAMAVQLKDLQVSYSREQTAEVGELMNQVLDVLKCKTAPSCAIRDKQLRRLLGAIRKAMAPLEGRVSVGLWSELWTVETLVGELVESAPKYDGAQTIVGVIHDTYAPPPPGLSLDDPNESFEESHPVIQKLRQFQAVMGVIEANKSAGSPVDLDSIYLSVFGDNKS